MLILISLLAMYTLQMRLATPYTACEKPITDA